MNTDFHTNCLSYADKAYSVPAEHDPADGYKRGAAILEYALSGSRPRDDLDEIVREVRANSHDCIYVPFQDGITHNVDQALMTKMVVRLSYCHQNNPEISRNLEFRPIHQKVYDLAIGLLTDQGDKLALAEFRYNKDLYLYTLDHPEDVPGQLATYEPVLDTFREALGEDDPTYLSKLAQVRNMQAIKSYKSDRPSAISYWREALDIREHRIPQNTWNEKYLLANVQSSLAVALVSTNLQEAYTLIEKACTFARSSERKHDYFLGYEKTANAIAWKRGWGPWIYYKASYFLHQYFG